MSEAVRPASAAISVLPLEIWAMVVAMVRGHGASLGSLACTCQTFRRLVWRARGTLPAADPALVRYAMKTDIAPGIRRLCYIRATRLRRCDEPLLDAHFYFSRLPSLSSLAVRLDSAHTTSGGESRHLVGFFRELHRYSRLTSLDFYAQLRTLGDGPVLPPLASLDTWLPSLAPTLCDLRLHVLETLDFSRVPVLETVLALTGLRRLDLSVDCWGSLFGKMRYDAAKTVLQQAWPCLEDLAIAVEGWLWNGDADAARTLDNGPFLIAGALETASARLRRLTLNFPASVEGHRLGAALRQCTRLRELVLVGVPLISSMLCAGEQGCPPALDRLRLESPGFYRIEAVLREAGVWVESTYQKSHLALADFVLRRCKWPSSLQSIELEHTVEHESTCYVVSIGSRQVSRAVKSRLDPMYDRVARQRTAVARHFLHAALVSREPAGRRKKRKQVDSIVAAECGPTLVAEKAQ